MKPLKEVYEDQPEDVRFRVPVFHGILILLVFLSFIVIASDIATGTGVSEFIGHAALSALTVAAWYFTRRGRYRIVSDTYFAVMETAMLVLRLAEGYAGPETFSSFAAILGSFLVFGAVFINSRAVLFGLCGLYSFSYFSFVAVVAFSGSHASAADFLDTNVAYPAIAVLAITFGLIATRLIFDRVIITVQRTLDGVRRLNERGHAVAADSAKQLAKADSLAEGSRQTALATGRIEENMNSIVGRIGHLDERIEHAWTVIEEMKATAGGLNELSREQAVYVSESGATFTQMVASIQNASRVIESRTSGMNDLIEAAAEGEKSATKTVESFSKVTAYLEAIRDMATVISDIADRTNLLAMNAAIQAAHAGDAGRGFAVVAGEIRSLAESSSTSAKGIADTLADLAASIEETGGSVDATGEAFRGIVGEIRDFSGAIREVVGNAKELETGTREIVGITTNLNSISQQVDERARHVSESQEAFAADVSSVAGISREITAETGEILSGITTIKGAVGGIHDQAEELLRQSRTLSETLKEVETV